MLLLAEPFIPGDMVTFQRNGVRYDHPRHEYHIDETAPRVLQVRGFRIILLVCINLSALMVSCVFNRWR